MQNNIVKDVGSVLINKMNSFRNVHESKVDNTKQLIYRMQGTFLKEKFNRITS